MNQERRAVVSSGGLRLEAMISVPHAASRAVVICHPHPQYGGTMDNNVVVAVAARLGQKGMATLRFNFRGVGESEGDYSGSFGEADDARAAASHLLRETRLDSVTLAGYSFGAMVALLAGHDHPAVSHQVAIGLPVTMFDTGFLAGCSKPSLFVLGDRDPYCPYDALERLVDSLPAPKRLVRVPGGDHFLVGFEDRVAEAVESFLCD